MRENSANTATCSKVVNLNDRLDLTYTLLPGRCPKDFSALALHNEAFSFWANFWKRTLAELANDTLSAEDFYRQDAIGLIRLRGEIVAMLHHSFIHIDSLAALSLPYLRGFSPTSLAKLRAQGHQTVMTMEYLTVAPGFRKSELGFSLASLVIGLGFELFGESHYDAMIATCRKDRKVDAMAAEFGSQALSEPFTMHDVPVVSIFTPQARLQKHAEPSFNALISRLWSERNSLLAPAVAEPRRTRFLLTSNIKPVAKIAA